MLCLNLIASTERQVLRVCLLNILLRNFIRQSCIRPAAEEVSCLLGCYDVPLGKLFPTFQRTVAFIFRSEQSTLFGPLFLSCMTLQMEALRSFHVSVTTHQSTRCNSPEDLQPYQHSSDNIYQLCGVSYKSSFPFVSRKRLLEELKFELLEYYQ